MEAEPRSAARVAWLLWCGAALLLLASLWHAARAGAAGAPLLVGLEPFAEGWIRGGGALLDGLTRVTATLRLPALVGLGAWLGHRLWRRQPPAADSGLGAALLLAWVAHSYLLAQRVAVGIALYALAAGVYRWGRGAPQSFAERLPVRLELPAALLLLALFALACLYRLDVQPEVYFDEIAYLNAARMSAGEIEPSPLGRAFGSPLYSLERFQAQVVPHALQVAAVSSLGAGIVPLRLVSLLCGVLALVVAHLTLRRRLGPRTALVALGLACASPVLLAYSRPGFYLAVSILHGALCFACLVALWERWSLFAALRLGVLLGGSLYLYQLSWFVPVFAVGAALALLPELLRRTRVVPIALASFAPLLLLAAPAVWLLSQGAGELGSQTFGRGIMNPGPGPAVAFLLAPGPRDAASLRSLRAELEDSGLHSGLYFSPGGVPVVTLKGPAEPMREAAKRLEGESWRSLFPERAAWEFPLHMLAQLFHARGWESSARLMEVPLLNPLLAPLLVLGVVEALRRRREPLMRILLVWIALAALLPATLGGVLPRRTILMFPFVAGLMVLPLREITEGFRRRAAVGLAALLVLAAGAVGHHQYFTAWAVHFPLVQASEADAVADPDPVSTLELARLVRRLPRTEPILMPRMLARSSDLLDLVAEPPALPGHGRILVVPAAIPPAAVQRRSCGTPPPFSWIFPRRPDRRALEEAVERGFDVEALTSGDFRVLRATVRKPGECAGS